MARQLVEMVNRECSAAAATIALLNNVPTNKEIPALKNWWGFVKIIEVISSIKKVLSKVLKPISSMLEIYKERSYIRSSLNDP